MIHIGDQRKIIRQAVEIWLTELIETLFIPVQCPKSMCKLVTKNMKNLHPIAC